MISHIVAISKNRVIGAEGNLPWDIPEDMQYFKDMTMKRIILMGRKTFETLPKPLPHRLNIVITRDADYRAKGAVVFTTIEEALEYAKSQVKEWHPEIFIIGGGEIYRQTMMISDRLYVTEIDLEVEGDAHYPPVSLVDFHEVSRRHVEAHPSYDFVVYERN